MTYKAEEIVIFLGPSCSLQEAETHLEARYFPPAKQGDILSIVCQFEPKVIGLIDGLFMQSLSVWHKEILYALSQGIHVLGASSMGALRAAETARFGMIGIGKIFELYHSWEITDDDEVALVHSSAEQGYISLSLPLINLRFTFDRAKKEHSLPKNICDTFFGIAQSLYYPDRTLDQIADRALKQGISQKIVSSVIEYLNTHYIDQKKEDAFLLLEKIKTLSSLDPLPRLVFEDRGTFEQLYCYDRRIIFPHVDVSIKQIAQYTALHHPNFAELQFQALNQALVTLLAKTIFKTEVSQTEIEQEKDRFRCRCNLSKDEEWHEWLARNHLSQKESEDFFKEKAMARKLHRSLVPAQIPWIEVKYLVDELKWTNQYEQWFQSTLSQEEILKKANPHYIETDHPELLEGKIAKTHMQETTWNPDCSYKEWALASGFTNTAELRMEMLKSKIVRNYGESE